MQLHRDRDRFAAAGANLVLIGQETPRHAQDFREEYGLDGLEILVDPGRETYGIAGTKVGTMSELLGPRSMGAALKRAATQRVMQGAVKGHAAQLGGVLVVAQDGSVAWNHLAQNAADNPPNDDVLAAVKAAGASAGGG